MTENGGTNKTLYISIGNSDDKLTQKEWASFVIEVREMANRRGQVHGEWFSEPSSKWQNACWCVELWASPNKTVEEETEKNLYLELGYIRNDYLQDSIAVAEVSGTRFV